MASVPSATWNQSGNIVHELCDTLLDSIGGCRIATCHLIMLFVPYVPPFQGRKCPCALHRISDHRYLVSGVILLQERQISYLVTIVIQRSSPYRNRKCWLPREANVVVTSLVLILQALLQILDYPRTLEAHLRASSINSPCNLASIIPVGFAWLIGTYPRGHWFGSI
jgi:hypothetical protein